MDDLPDDVEALRRVRFFSDLTPEDLARIAAIGERRTFAAGEDIVRRDDDRGGLYVLLSGSAEVDAGGKRHTLAPGDFVGEMGLLARVPRSATVTATEPVEAMVLETIAFKPFLIKNPSVAVHLLEVVAERLREVQDRVERGG
jgi:CRP-like cAMP-binding protein